jgi:hypothetical protein
MEAVSKWGHDLMDSWRLSREVRRVERDLASILGQAYRPEPLPREPVVLREMLRDRQAAVNKASATARLRQEEKKGQERSKLPPKGDRGGGKVL